MTFRGFSSNRGATGRQQTQHAFNFNQPLSSVSTLTADGLCRDCAALDLETAFARGHELYEDARRGFNTRRLASCRSANGTIYLRDFYFVTSLGRRLAENRGCKLCDFFKHHVDDPGHHGKTFKALVVCSSEASLFRAPRRNARGRLEKRRDWDEMEYNVFLTVVPEVDGIPRTGVPLRWLETEVPRKGAIYRATEEVADEDGKRLVLPGVLGPKADFVKFGYWRYNCEESHGPLCTPRKPPNQTVTGFKVINCSKRPFSVERVSWREKYVALSYVWGDYPDTDRWPQTIRDAVAFTIYMREKYLWVDKLCIDQSNAEEKKYMCSKMDAIYEGAEFTIVNAAGDARTGLPGVTKVPRTPQHKVELNASSARVNLSGRGPTTSTSSSRPGNSDDVYRDLLNVPGAEYDAETQGHSLWLDNYRHGLNNNMELPLDEMLSLAQGPDRAAKYGIPAEHVDFYEDSAEHFGLPFDEFMETQKELARRIGITLPELVPYLQRDLARKAGIPDSEPLRMPTAADDTVVSHNRPKKPLPPGKTPGKITLVSTMQDPRVTIRKSRWATRGWTYQEGVLSRRCLVVTPEQVYWECRGMAVHESIKLPLPTLHTPVWPMGVWCFADYMLSGVFRGDMHRTPELQYGFQGKEGDDDDGAAATDAGGRVKSLDGHIRAYTARELKWESDSLNAFLGISNRYSSETDRGLSLILGIPVWTGAFADGRPGLQHSFAMSVSVWFHVGEPTEPGSELYYATCPRRADFPSWSWIGWAGRVDFNGDNTDNSPRNKEENNNPTCTSRADNDGYDDEEDERNMADDAHIDFFKAMTSSDWARSVDRLYSASMVLHTEDGAYSTLLSGSVSLRDFPIDADKKWLLTIKKPFVLGHLRTVPSRNRWEWGRLMEKEVEVRMSVPCSERELKEGHASGEMLSVLLFAGTVPFVWDVKARFLVLRRVGANSDSGAKGEERWERLGRLVLTMEEWMMGEYTDAQAMVKDLPVRDYGRDLTLV
ncbi:HET-domain-containing protein [Sodiomyces alkalinus F11]|uniref:HET-domain-containing protein n=1 Tax=Sodiomyces alkalinus (strain CBS 110278 / VKM F-3762 / F11) TaxID=1314773 RepID=A0A3N2PTF4_SODAK|nr:HET-domain-containing protein [Sodiomyces alkalinus F11]ROT37768.1 HET-domain-containing protein [Sodiomyces alkalinus F11]